MSSLRAREGDGSAPSVDAMAVDGSASVRRVEADEARSTGQRPIYGACAEDYSEAQKELDSWREDEKNVGDLSLRDDFINDCHGSKVMDMTADGDRRMMWAMRGSDRIGYAAGRVKTGRRGARVFELLRLFVKRGEREGGAGSRLVRTMVEKAGCDWFELGLGLRSQTASVGFWTKYGFRSEGLSLIHI